MATYTISGLKQDIRVALDQNNVSTQLFNTSDIDTLTLDELIESKIVDAVRYVDLAAPLYMFDSTTAFPNSSTTITWEGTAGIGAGSVILPEDFLRLASFKMSDWDRPAFVPIQETDPLYAAQRSVFNGIRGNWQRPVVAIVTGSGANARRLEFYSCHQVGETTATVQQASYIPMPVVSSGNISICTPLKTPAVYYAAYLVAMTLGDANKAKVLLDTCNSMLQ